MIIWVFGAYCIVVLWRFQSCLLTTNSLAEGSELGLSCRVWEEWLVGAVSQQVWFVLEPACESESITSTFCVSCSVSLSFTVFMTLTCFSFFFSFIIGSVQLSENSPLYAHCVCFYLTKTLTLLFLYIF